MCDLREEKDPWREGVGNLGEERTARAMLFPDVDFGCHSEAMRDATELIWKRINVVESVKGKRWPGASPNG